VIATIAGKRLELKSVWIGDIWGLLPKRKTAAGAYGEIFVPADFGDE
jgi:hypothetical protein